MNLTSPAPVSPASRLDDSALDLRVNQRLNAEVLKINGGQVVLSIQGVQIVGRLASMDQAAVLIERQFAHFIVKDVSDKTVILQVAPPQTSPAGDARAKSPDLAAGILDQQGIPSTPENLQLARAAMGQGLEITADLLEELRSVLNAAGMWDARAVQTAAALKAAGLPLTPGSLELAMRNPAETAAALDNLLANLRSFLSGSASPESLALAQAAFEGLENLILPAHLSAPELAERLRQLTAALGRPLENLLARQLTTRPEGLNPFEPENLLLALSDLRAQLAPAKDASLTTAIDRFLESVRQMQFFNLPADPAPDRGQWLGLTIPISHLIQTREGGDPTLINLHQARLHIARDADPERPGGVRPGYTRIVVQVDLAPGETLQVDFSIVKREIGADITASTQGLTEQAKAELPALETGLEEAGYRLLTAQIHTGKALPPKGFALPAPLLQKLPPVDLEA